MTEILRRHATTIALSVLAAIALVVVLVVDRGSVSTSEAEHRRVNLLESWRRDDVTQVLVEKSGRRARLVRTPPDKSGTEVWTVELDGQTHATDPQVVDDFLTRLGDAMFERRVSPASVDRTRFGLDTPRLAVTVSMGRLTYRVAIGAPAPSPPDAAYADVNDKDVFVIAGQLVAALDGPVDRFRSASLVPYASVDLGAIDLDGAAGPRHLVRAPWSGSRGAGFRFDGGAAEQGGRVDEQALDRWLAALGRMKAETFLDVSRADSLGSRELVLRLRPKDASLPAAVIELGGACPDRADLVVAIRRAPSPEAACVSKRTLEALDVRAADWLDQHLVGAAPDAITEVKVESGGSVIEFARSGSGWHVRKPFDREVAQDVGGDIVDAMTRATASRFATRDGHDGAPPPRATVRVYSVAAAPREGDAGDERVEVLEIGAEQGGVVAVRRTEDGMTAIVTRETASDLLPSELALRPRKVIDIPAKDFAALRITASSSVQDVRRTPQGGWELVTPEGRGLAADIGLASDVADVLGGITAERWVAPRDDGSFGLGKPRVIIEARIASDAASDAGAARPMRVELGSPLASGGSYARESGDDAVFVAPKTLESVADRWLIDRAALRVDPNAVTNVTLTAGSKHLRVERSGDAWRVADGGAAERGDADAARAAAVRDVLSEIMAEGAVSIGKPKPEQRLAAPALVAVIERSSGDRLRLVVGGADVWRGTSIYYVRRDDIDATYAVSQSALRPLLDAPK